MPRLYKTANRAQMEHDMAAHQPATASFAGLVDLAAERYGGRALVASDEFFAEKENLLKPGRGVFIEDKYTDRGKWMDGWESRRKRVPGHDWCVIELGWRGVIRGLDIDTNHFLGNHPPFASVEAAVSAEGPWTELLPRAPLNPGSQNLFAVQSTQAWSHVRLNIYPDGGVARFRVFGEVVPAAAAPGEPEDLAGLAAGGRAVACSDQFFSNANNMLQPGDSLFMGDGWETRRRRGPGHDWAIVRLARRALIHSVRVGTQHYKGNFPDGCSLEICDAGAAHVDVLNAAQQAWTEILPRTRLAADAQRDFAAELKVPGPATHLRINIYPDGGISRLRVFAVPS